MDHQTTPLLVEYGENGDTVDAVRAAGEQYTRLHGYLENLLETSLHIDFHYNVDTGKRPCRSCDARLKEAIGGIKGGMEKLEEFLTDELKRRVAAMETELGGAKH